MVRTCIPNHSRYLGTISLDLTQAEFDNHVIDLHVYTGWGSITIIVPQAVDVQVIRHRGGADSRLDLPVPGLPLVPGTACRRSR